MLLATVPGVSRASKNQTSLVAYFGSLLKPEYVINVSNNVCLFESFVFFCPISALLYAVASMTNQVLQISYPYSSKSLLGLEARTARKIV